MVEVAVTSIPSIAEIIGIIAIGTILWNVSRRIANYENERKNLEAKHNSDIEALKQKIEANHKESIDKIHEAAIERTKQINEANLAIKDQFNALQKQLDNKSVDIKSVDTRVTQAITQISNICKELAEIKDDIKLEKEFRTDWNQRIENRVEEARKAARELIENAERRLMGMMNMLIQMRKSNFTLGNDK